jgi:selenophosphate synthetase-related protein
MWIEAIVMPRENDSRPYRPAPQRDRAAVYKAGRNESQEFHATVVNYLQANELMHAVKSVSEPGSLPVVTLRCQQRVLELLRKSSEFEAGQSLSLELQS